MTGFARPVAQAERRLGVDFAVDVADEQQIGLAQGDAGTDGVR